MTCLCPDLAGVVIARAGAGAIRCCWAGLVTSGGQRLSPEAHTGCAGQAWHASGITGAKTSFLALLYKSLRTFTDYII